MAIKGGRLIPNRKGVRFMTDYEILSLIIAIGMLIIAILSLKKNEK